MDFHYATRFVWDDLFRWSMFWHRDAHGYIATGQQSGSHWLNHLLAETICEQYRVPRPQHIDDRTLIGHPRRARTHAHIPRLVWTHHAPSPVVHATPFRQTLRFPRYVVLVRDIRAAMVSRYEKRKHDFQMTFSEYLREQRLFSNPNKWDMLKRIMFFNAWGRVAQRIPERVHIMHYESLRRDTTNELRRVWKFLALPVSDPAMFERASSASTKEKMSRNEEPGRRLDLVRKDERDPVEWFDAADRDYFAGQCARYLQHPLGYDYTDWSSAKQMPQSGSASASPSPSASPSGVRAA